MKNEDQDPHHDSSVYGIKIIHDSTNKLFWCPWWRSMWTTKGMNDYMTLNCCKYLMKTANPFSERYGWWVNCGLSVIAWSHCSIAWVFLAFASPTSQVSCPPNQAKSCLAHRFQNGCWKKKYLSYINNKLYFLLMFSIFPYFQIVL